jgi:hypothetical protein
MYVCKCVLLPPGVNPIAVKYIIIYQVERSSIFHTQKKMKIPNSLIFAARISVDAALKMHYLTNITESLLYCHSRAIKLKDVFPDFCLFK